MQHVIITSMSYLTHYRTFSLSVPWFGAIYKKYINIFEKMMVTNALQVAQNQENLRENIPSGAW